MVPSLMPRKVGRVRRDLFQHPLPVEQDNKGWIRCLDALTDSKHGTRGVFTGHEPLKDHKVRWVSSPVT